METSELLDMIARGEDSRRQFKADVANPASLASEIVAFCNSGGGDIFIGVSDDGSVTGLTSDDIKRLNSLASNASSQLVYPPAHPRTENIATVRGLVMVLSVPDGPAKPYHDNSGVYWVKSGADKRKVTSREELRRIFQESGMIHGDEIPAAGFGVADLDRRYFETFFEKIYGEPLEKQTLPLPTLLENMNLMKDGIFNISGALLFTRNPSMKLPQFIVKAIAFPGAEVHESAYLDSRDIGGKLADIFDGAMSFVLANIRHIQNNQGVNSVGTPEIPRIVLEELIANALIHRDYFITAPVRLFVFRDRVEIISPGGLPNNLTIENIKNGNSNIRNPILASHASRLLPYRGLGTGIIRALKAWPHIGFQDDRDGNKFVAVIRRA